MPTNGAFLGADRSCRLKAIHRRHLHIHQDQIERFVAQGFQRLFAVVRHRHGMAALREHLDCDFLIYQAIFGQQNMPHREVRRPRRRGLLRSDSLLRCQSQRVRNRLQQSGLFDRLEQAP